jgi:hypothetical protein
MYFLRIRLVVIPVRIRGRSLEILGTIRLLVRQYRRRSVVRSNSAASQVPHAVCKGAGLAPWGNMKKESDKNEGVPLREEYGKPKCQEQVKDEISYRKVEKPTKVPHAWGINRFS